jgi:Icc-related predicted phosphoesterase
VKLLLCSDLHCDTAAAVVCGHIHASAGEETLLGATAVVNAGPEGLVRELR